MIFQILSIELDFSDSFDPISEEQKQELYDEIVGGVWEADDEEDLLDEITCCTGWCINNIDFRYILS
jgi:hypothetical protein